MTYEELIAATAEKIGLEGFAPDDDGVCVLQSEVGEIAILKCTDPLDCVLLNASVADVPAAADAALLAAMKANNGFIDMHGATLAVDAETNRFELSQYAFLADLDADSFVAMIERFAASLVDMRKKIDGAKVLKLFAPRSGEGFHGVTK